MPAEAASLGAPPGFSLSRVLGHSAWLLNASLAVRALNLARGIILARLLMPDDFGLFGLASVVIGFTLIFGDVGAGIFLLYQDKNVEEHADTAFWANLGIATVLSGGVALTSPLVAEVYARPDLTPILLVLGVSLWLTLAGTVHRNLLRRASRFRALALLDVALNVAWFLLAVGLAWAGFGVWAFVWSNLGACLLHTALLAVTLGWRPRWRFSSASLAALAPFSTWYLASALAWYVVLNVDNLLVGKYLGIESLGFYGLAFNYASVPLTLVMGPLGTMIFAELPPLRSDPARFWDAFQRYSRLVAALGCPLAFALLAAAPDLFPAVFGPRWLPAVLPFQILCVYAAVRCLWVDPFAALGRFDVSFAVGLATTALSAAAILLALPWGLPGVAAAVLGSMLLAQGAGLCVAARTRRQLTTTLQATGPYFGVALLASLLALALRAALFYAVPVPAELAAAVVVGCTLGTYALVWRRELLKASMILLGRQGRA